MRKRLLSTILMVVILITSIQIDAFALPDDYNANNFIVDKTEQYGGSHLVITNTSTSSGQPTGVLPIAGSVEDAVPLNDMDGEADEDVYGYDLDLWSEEMKKKLETSFRHFKKNNIKTCNNLQKEEVEKPKNFSI